MIGRVVFEICVFILFQKSFLEANNGGSKLEESRSSSSLLACRPRMFHCKIIGINNQKGFWLSESESALSTSVSRVEYRLFVGSSESDLGGLLSFDLPLLSALLD